jgi:hypothetical protein
MIFQSPSRDVTYQTPAPARECLVSAIPAGDGKIDNLFLQCTLVCLLDNVTRIRVLTLCSDV